MTERKYGYLCEPVFKNFGEVKSILRHLQENDMDGLFLIEPNISTHTETLAALLRASGITLIVAYTDNPTGLAFDYARLEAAKNLTNNIALGSSPTHEWGGYRNDVELVGTYKKFAKEQGFRWVCTLGYGELARDIRARKLHDALKSTPCVCLCGHILAGYVFGDLRIPNQGYQPNGNPWGSMTGRNLYKTLGLDGAALTSWLAGMDVMSGVGYQAGLEAGARIYLRALGFSGFVCGFPLDIAGTDDIPVCVAPETPPPRLGHLEGYCTA